VNRLNGKLPFRPAAPGWEPEQGLFLFGGALPVSATCRCVDLRKALQLLTIPLSLANEIREAPFRRLHSYLCSGQAQ